MDSEIVTPIETDQLENETTNRTNRIILIVGLVLLLLCCCCSLAILIGWAGWTYGDFLLEQLNTGVSASFTSISLLGF